MHGKMILWSVLLKLRPTSRGARRRLALPVVEDEAARSQLGVAVGFSTGGIFSDDSVLGVWKDFAREKVNI